MARTTRPVEMYVGLGEDSGTWHTEYVDIPIDTPDDKIFEAAMFAGQTQIKEFVFIGVYSVTSIDELEEEFETDDNGNCKYCGEDCSLGEMCDEQQAGGF